ncbi:MAG: transposase [Salinivirgaceae bacterium]|nr:transposase [Salinivirgaceae bacterium]
MKFKEYYLQFPEEELCIKILKTLREQKGLLCKKCGNQTHYWKKDKKKFECKRCKFRTSLKTGTVMENSNLPLRYWLATISYLNTTKKNISALNLQQEFGHKRYEPIWLMLKKIKSMPETDFLNIKNN